MSWLKKISQTSQSSLSSQEPKVCYSKKEEEEEEMTTSEFKDCNEVKVESTQDDSQSSCYSWSGVSQAINIKGENRSWDESEEEEEKWWAAFQLEPSTQASTSSQGTSSQKIEEKNDDDDDDDDYDQTQTQTQIQDETEKISFYLKLGKYKKFEFM